MFSTSVIVCSIVKPENLHIFHFSMQIYKIESKSSFCFYTEDKGLIYSNITN